MNPSHAQLNANTHSDQTLTHRRCGALSWPLLWLTLCLALLSCHLSMAKASIRGTALSGVYIIGPAPSDYLNLQNAFDAIMTDGIAAPVQLKFKPGIHEVHASLTAFDRHGQVDDLLTITSLDLQNPATLQHAAVASTDNWVIKLSQIESIQIDHLLLQSTGNDVFSNLLVFGGISNSDVFIHHNAFYNRHVDDATAETSAASINCSQPTALDNTRIVNNLFNAGNAAIRLIGSVDNPMQQIHIRGNRFDDQSAAMDFYTLSVTHANGLSIEDNEIYNSLNNAKGVRIDQTSNALINANRLFMLGGGNGGQAFVMNAANDALPGQTDIQNNIMLASLRTLHIGTSSQNVHVQHNTLAATGALIGDTESAALKFSTSSAQANNLYRSNILYSDHTHGMAHLLQIDHSSSIASASDNVYDGQMQHPMQVDGVNHGSLTDHQNGTGLDATSLAKIIDFVDPGNADFHLTATQLLDADLIVPAAFGVIFDVDGETRLPHASTKGADDLDAESVFNSGFE